MKDRGRGYAHRVDVVATPLEVWQALTTPEHLARWCSTGAQIRPQRGGIFRARVDKQTELEASIDVFEPGRRMRLIYLPNPAWPPSTEAIVDDFILDPKGGVTIVRLLGSGIPGDAQWNQPFQRLRTGWQQAMSRLKVFTEKQFRSNPP